MLQGAHTITIREAGEELGAGISGPLPAARSTGSALIPKHTKATS